MTRRVRSALRPRRRRSSSPSSQASDAATAARSSRSSVPRAKKIYIYPGLLRIARHSAIALDARCPASVYRGDCGDTATCAICLETFHGRDLVRRLPCEHAFHTRCILNWFVSNDRCPLCNDIVSAHPVRQKVNINAPPPPPQLSPTTSPTTTTPTPTPNGGPRTYSFIVHDAVRMEVDRAAAAASAAPS